MLVERREREKCFCSLCDPANLMSRSQCQVCGTSWKVWETSDCKDSESEMNGRKVVTPKGPERRKKKVECCRSIATKMEQL